jgi:hypothetical protein
MGYQVDPQLSHNGHPVGGALVGADSLLPFGGKLSFIPSLLFPERLHCCNIYFHCSYMYNYYNYFRILCIKC